MTKSESHVFMRTISDQAPMAVAAKGMELTYEDPVTKERKTVIDSMTGAAVGSLGHGDPEIMQAMVDASTSSIYSFVTYFSNYAAEDLAKFICGLYPKGHFTSACWVGSGSEANEHAIKFAHQYHQELGDYKRYKIISRKHSYHGFTIGALSISDNLHNREFAGMLGNPKTQYLKVSECNSYLEVTDEFTEEMYTAKLLKEIEDTILANDPETISCFICESVGGSTFGTQVPPKGYLDGVRDICDKYGMLMILDEVMAGMGRAGIINTYGKFMTSGRGPDMLTCGKVIGSGYVTLAGVLVSPKVVEAYEKGSNTVWGAQTYCCHEFNCKVALAVQKKIQRDNLIPTAAKAGQWMQDTIREQLKDSKIVGDVRGLPLFFAVVFCNPKTKKAFPTSWKIAPKVTDQALENGITTMPIQGTMYYEVKDGKASGVGDHVMVAPSYVLTMKEAKIIADALVKAVKEVEATLDV